jgi:hypothetical protein
LDSVDVRDDLSDDTPKDIQADTNDNDDNEDNLSSNN